jgi:hypothetical protein
MSVRTFRKAADFPQNIRQALREGQEPVLAFSVHPFYRGKKAAFFQQGMQTPRTHEIYISMEDADWTQGTTADHAVFVTGCGSMKDGETLVIKDSNLESPWLVASINVLVPPSADKNVWVLLCNAELKHGA